MSTQKYDYDFLVFIGRFRPFHAGHKKIVKEALRLGKHVIILIGSAYSPRTLRNPWTEGEVIEMIESVFDREELIRMSLIPIRDVLYNDEAWISNVQTIVNGVIASKNKDEYSKPRIALIGHEKDETSYYLKLFPQWESIGVRNYLSINGTDIRDQYFKDGYLPTRGIPSEVSLYLYRWFSKDPEIYNSIKEEKIFIENYKRQWKNSPYPPTFVTTDAVVIQSGHILLVERKALPGKGLLALPGGFLKSTEKLIDGCIRELREETKLKVPSPVLKGSIKNQYVFDYPKRSTRGRTITYAYHFQLRADTSLPRVKGSDDAARAFWKPLSDLNSCEMYEDHYYIIQKFVGVL